MVRRPLASTLLGGVVLGVLWRVVGPLSARVSDQAEGAAAEDGTFFLLAVVAGLISAGVLHRRPGRSAVRRFLLVLAASVPASALAVVLSVLTGGPRLTAWGGLALWPLVLSASVLVVTAQGLLSAHDGEPAVIADSPVEPIDRQDAL